LTPPREYVRCAPRTQLAIMTTMSGTTNYGGKSIQAGGHKIPGYQGYISGMKNHVVGKRYSEATMKAGDCIDVLRGGGNPDQLAAVHLDNRPQGRDYLYAQVSSNGAVEAPRIAPPHVGKRRPLLHEAVPGQGENDFRIMKIAIGSPGPGSMSAEGYASASLPKLPYSAKKFFTGEEVKTGAQTDTKGNLPGYTGHQHAAQHVYAKSYGSTTKDLQNVEDEEMMQRSLKLLSWGEGRPVGDILTEKHRIPGYQGYIPGKDNHIYAKTYGNATNLAPSAENTMAVAGNASTIVSLVDTRPQGEADLYAQGYEASRTGVALPVHVSKGTVKVKFLEEGKDHKMREVVYDDTKEVKTAKHRVVGYTGHVHGQQHVYAKSYGKMTRSLHGGQANLTNPTTSAALLHYGDDRPEYSHDNKYGRQVLP